VTTAAAGTSSGTGKNTARGRGAAPRRTLATGVRDLVVLVLIVVMATLLVRAFVVAPFSIPSGSMENSLKVGDRILVDRMSYHFHGVRRGDVVVFDGTDTFGRLGNGKGETDYVKRVIGLPGDHVVCCDSHLRITVNGTPLHEERYLHPGDDPSDQRFDIKVPPGRLWLMGDHRSDSLDSRAHLGDPGGGTVPVDKVVGRVLVVVWPLDRLGGLRDVPVGSAARRSPPTGSEGRTR
jgi:signal peptidase I